MEKIWETKDIAVKLLLVIRLYFVLLLQIYLLLVNSNKQFQVFMYYGLVYW
jgi:hypothetical protein